MVSQGLGEITFLLLILIAKSTDGVDGCVDIDVLSMLVFAQQLQVPVLPSVAVTGLCEKELLFAMLRPSYRVVNDGSRKSMVAVHIVCFDMKTVAAVDTEEVVQVGGADMDL